MVRSSQAYLKRDNLSNIIWCTQKQIWRCTSRCVPIGTRSVLDDSRVHAHIPCVWSLNLERSNRRQSRVLFLSPTGVFFFLVLALLVNFPWRSSPSPVFHCLGFSRDNVKIPFFNNRTGKSTFSIHKSIAFLTHDLPYLFIPSSSTPSETIEH